MQTKKLIYREFLQRESTLIRAPYNPEQEFYIAISTGNEERVKEFNKERFLEKPGFGSLSDNPVQDLKYHFVITAALAARKCIESGMEMSQAYSLSDFYIQKADACTTQAEISEIHSTMCLDYCKRMKYLVKQKVCSIHITKCLDYIYENLHTRITVQVLSDKLGLNPSYLSRLFKKEIGLSVSEYILQKKIEAAQNMLLYSDYSLSQIAFTLAFPSQSYFSEIFKKRHGVTPSQYRSRMFRNENE